MGSIYVHVPFCVRKCAYCDFVSSPLADAGGLVPSYLEAVKLELERAAPRIRGIAPITSVFIGGGTPTCLPLRELESLVAMLAQSAAQAPGATGEIEFTVEANPATISRAGLSRLRRAGVNRLSIGVQSLDPRELAVLGRVHTAEQALSAVDDARAAGFENISVDLILGAPGQTPDSLRRTLAGFLALDRPPEHVSAYCLQLETGTPLERSVSLGETTVPDADDTAKLYEVVVEALSRAGYARYEVSNFALGGRECVHNLGYWRGGMYVGLGPAAHSHLPSSLATLDLGSAAATEPMPSWVRSWNTASTQEYVRKVMSRGSPEDGRETLDAEAEARDRVMLGLRTAAGVDLHEIDAECGTDLSASLMPLMRERQTQRLVEIDGARVKIAPQAMLISNLVLVDSLR